MRSERSEGSRKEHREFACSFPTRSDSQRRWDFMSNLNETKVRYLQAKEVRKEEAGGIGEPTLFNIVWGWPLHHRMKRGTVDIGPALLGGANCGSTVAESHQKERGQGLGRHMLGASLTFLLAMLPVCFVNHVASYIVQCPKAKPCFQWPACPYKIKLYIIGLVNYKCVI